MTKKIRSPSNHSRASRAGVVTLVYLALASLWIVLSGNLIDLIPNVEAIRHDLEVFKGLLFVLVTGSFLYLLLRAWEKKQAANLSAGKPREEETQLPVTTRRLVLFLLGLCWMGGIIGYLAFSYLETVESQKFEQQISAITKIKAQDIEGRIRQHLKYAYVAGHESILANFTEEWRKRGSLSPSDMRLVHQRLSELMLSHDYSRLAILDPDNNTRIAIGETAPPGSEKHIKTLLKNAIDVRKPLMGKIYWFTKENGTRYARLPMIMPLLPKGDTGDVTDAILFEINPQIILFPLIQSWPTHSKTAETGLIERDGDDVVILSEMRLQSTHAEPRFNMADHPNMLSVQIAQGATGLVQGLDYRGASVVGYGIKIPNTNWIMISKMDVDEIEQPIRMMAVRIALTILLILLALALALYFWWRQKRSQYESARKNAELQKQALIKHFDYLSKYANDIILLMDENGKIAEANDRAETAYGRTREELIGMHILDLRAASNSADVDDLLRVLRNESSQLYETRHVHRNGTEFPVEVSSRRIETDSGIFVQHIIRDITERKTAEQRAKRLQNMYHALGETTNAIMRLEDEAELFPMACRIAVEMGGMLLSWVGRPDAAGKYVIPVFVYGQAREFIEGIKIPMHSDEPESRGPSSTAIRESRTVVIHDVLTDPQTTPWYEAGKKYSIRSAASFPVMRNGKPYAVFVVYNNQPYSFDNEIVELLNEVASSLSFALDNFDRESARQRGEASLRESEARLKLVADESPFPTMVHAEDGEILQVNHAWLNITGYAMEDLPNHQAWREKAYGDRAAAVAQHIQSVFESEKRMDSGEFHLRCKNGSRRIWHFMSTPLGKLPDGRRYIITTANDVTENKKAEDQLRLAATVFESNKSCILITDVQGTILSVNPAFTEMTGYAEAEAIGQTPHILRSGRYGKEFYENFWHALRTKGYWHGEMWNKRKNGEEYLAWLTVNAVSDPNSVPVNFIGIAEDITQIQADKTQIEFLAHYDSLTKLPNRQLAKDRLEQAISHAIREKSHVALIYLDLDNFRVINDTLGHFVGDNLLKSFADRLHLCVRQTDTISRQGGDEFLVLLPDITELESVNAVANKILEQVGIPFNVDGNVLCISSSIGIAIFPEDGTNSETLLKNADVAMYNAKQAGRNTFRFYAENMNTLFKEHLRIRNDLTRALENGEFILHYQPQIELTHHTVSGAEALIRWQHPEMGLLPPGRFIAIAEESGMIAAIGKWVIHEACRQAVEWQKAGLPRIVVSVNISALQFKRGDLEQIVASALTETGLEAQYLELELTESILIQDVEKSLEMVQRFEDLGVRMAIDDFGTGYSSLSYLQRLPVHKLKIDQSFIQNLTTQESSAAIALSIITLAHSLDKTVIAEGVETEEQLAFLREHRCNEIQGYYFSPPLPAEDFANFMKRPLAAS